MERPQKILFLCHRVPFPPDKGDRIRSYQVLNTLAELGHVYLGFVADEQLDVKTRGYLALKCERVCAHRPLAPLVASRPAFSWGEEPDGGIV